MPDSAMSSGHIALPDDSRLAQRPRVSNGAQTCVCGNNTGQLQKCLDCDAYYCRKCNFWCSVCKHGPFCLTCNGRSRHIDRVVCAGNRWLCTRCAGVCYICDKWSSPMSYRSCSTCMSSGCSWCIRMCACGRAPLCKACVDNIGWCEKCAIPRSF